MVVRAIKTKSRGTGEEIGFSFRYEAIAALRRRFALFRTTAFPTFFEAVNPTRGRGDKFSVSCLLRVRTCKTKEDMGVLYPYFVKRRKSWRFLRG